MELDRYAALHAQTYGKVVDAMALIPHMLEAFMVGYLGFKKGASPKIASQRPLRRDVSTP